MARRLGLLLFLAGCQSRVAPTEVPQPADAAAPESYWFIGRAALSTATHGGVAGHEVACEPLRACVRRVVGAGYTRQQLPAIAACAGSAQAWWSARECLPMSVGADAVTGDELWLTASCGDVCPTYASLHVLYADVGSPDECLCHGGSEQLGASIGGGRYVGCGLPLHVEGFHFDGFRLTEVHDEEVPAWFERSMPAAFRSPRADRPRFGLARTTDVLRRFGLGDRVEIVSIDGVATSDPARLRERLRAFAALPPARPELYDFVRGRRREVTVVDSAAMRELAQRSPALPVWQASSRCRTQRDCFTLRARIDGAEYVRYYSATEPDGLPFAALAGEMQRLAERWRAPLVPQSDRIPCRELRTLPTLLSFTRPDRTELELRYVGVYLP